MDFDFNNNNYFSSNSRFSAFSTIQPIQPLVGQLTTSVSRVFATANELNGDRHDEVFYSRETMHLLAKFLATNSSNKIFRKIYEYAPDNLAWLWAFFDWETQIDLNQVTTQDKYRPFSVHTDKPLSYDESDLVNQLISEAPLIKTHYNEQMTICDVYRIIEYCLGVKVYPVAVALFSLYFPRFEKYMDNTLSQFTRVCILKSNLTHIAHIDNLLCKLVHTRYTNLNEYKLRISTRQNLPKHLQTILIPTNHNNNLTTKWTTSAAAAAAAYSVLDNSPQFTRTSTSSTLIPHNFNFPSTSQQQKKSTFTDFCGLNDSILDVNVSPFEPQALLSPKFRQTLLQPPQALSSPRTPSTTTKFNFTNSASILNNNNESLNNEWSNNTDNSLLPISQQPPISPPHGFYTTTNSPTSLLAQQAKKSISSTSTTSSSSEQHNLLQDNNYNNNNLLNNDDDNDDLAQHLRRSAFISSPISPLTINKLSTTWKTPTPTSTTVFQQQQQQQQRMRQNSNQIDQFFADSSINCLPLSSFNDVFLDSISPNGSYTSGNSIINDINGAYNNNNKNNNYHHQHQHNKRYNSHNNNGRQFDDEKGKPWSGRLPPKRYPIDAIYSRKVFLGGLPFDVDLDYLINILQKYGPVKIDMPPQKQQQQQHRRNGGKQQYQQQQSSGHTYIAFEYEHSVQRLLADCRKDEKNGGEHYYFSIPMPQQQQLNYSFNSPLAAQTTNTKRRAKEVEVIPWNQDDISYVPGFTLLPAKIDSKKTIFVGALHGMLTAHGLAIIMGELFGEVVHAGLDTDKYKYPIGSGRVTFRQETSYKEAIKWKFADINSNSNSNDPSPKIAKKLQMDPYLEESKCTSCDQRSTLFCRNEMCLTYFCDFCFKDDNVHVRFDGTGGKHEGFSRNKQANHQQQQQHHAYNNNNNTSATSIFTTMMY